jgi:hypothetical protein
MNITDIDDKIIINSQKAGQTLEEFGRYWEAQYFEDMEKLEIEPPDILTRVTEYVLQCSYSGIFGTNESSGEHSVIAVRQHANHLPDFSTAPQDQVLH